ncbi:MAG: SDR family NAD(P)-dependent oxidoreductase [Treponema sp.]
MKKIAIVTGASSGIGHDIALLLHNYFELDELWLMARRLDRLTSLAERINEENAAVKARAVEIDITGRKGVEHFASLLRAEQEENGDFEISVLVNNAGVGTYGTFEETPVARELEMIELNCIALTGFCGEALKRMKRGAQIINTASLAAFMPLGNFAAYAATKAYVLSFSVALSAELKPRGIRVCALCPGPVETEFANVASGGARVNVLHGVPSLKVAEHCLKCAAKGKRIAVMTFTWKLQAFLSRLLSRYAVAAITFKFFKRPCNNG